MNINKAQSSELIAHGLKGKRILITAGPTWVAIDKVRVISNIATGETGILLAERLQDLGADVTLLLGPFPNEVFLRRVSSGSRRETEAKTTFGTYACCLNRKIKLLRFKFFQELKDLINRQLGGGRKYDAIIHSAAVSDFRLKQCLRGKLDSNKIHSLKLIPLPKIIENIRRLAPHAKLIMFKLELGVSGAILIQRAKAAQLKLGTDFVVANRINPYRAFIIDRKGNTIPVKSKTELVERLLKILSLTFNFYN